MNSYTRKTVKYAIKTNFNYKSQRLFVFFLATRTLLEPFWLLDLSVFNRKAGGTRSSARQHFIKQATSRVNTAPKRDLSYSTSSSPPVSPHSMTLHFSRNLGANRAWKYCRLERNDEKLKLRIHGRVRELNLITLRLEFYVWIGVVHLTVGYSQSPVQEQMS